MIKVEIKEVINKDDYLNPGKVLDKRECGERLSDIGTVYGLSEVNIRKGQPLIIWSGITDKSYFLNRKVLDRKILNVYLEKNDILIQTPSKVYKFGRI